MDKQKIEKALEALKNYNRWRRGQSKECPNASFIGESIEYIVDLVTTEILHKK